MVLIFSKPGLLFYTGFDINSHGLDIKKYNERKLVLTHAGQL